MLSHTSQRWVALALLALTALLVSRGRDSRDMGRRSGRPDQAGTEMPIAAALESDDKAGAKAGAAQLLNPFGLPLDSYLHAMAHLSTVSPFVGAELGPETPSHAKVADACRQGEEMVDRLAYVEGRLSIKGGGKRRGGGASPHGEPGAAGSSYCHCCAGLMQGCCVDAGRPYSVSHAFGVFSGEVATSTEVSTYNGGKGMLAVPCLTHTHTGLR